jgi:hypothetical protein
MGLLVDMLRPCGKPDAILGHVASWGDRFPRARILPKTFALSIGKPGFRRKRIRERRPAPPADRRAIFAAQFALSHACRLLTYPIAGWLGGTAGLATTSVILAIVTGAGVAAAATFWPANDPDIIEHEHPNSVKKIPTLKAPPALVATRTYS